MPQPRRALQLPLVPVSGSRREQSLPPPSAAAAQQGAVSTVPRPPPRSSAQQRTGIGALSQGGRVRSQTEDVRAVHEGQEGGGGPLHEVAWLREQLREQLQSKDEQTRELLRAKDEQMRAKDEQILKLLEHMRAKDEQISGLMTSMSPISPTATHQFPVSPVPYRPLSLPSPPVASPAAASAVAATAEQRRHTRQAHLRAAEEVSAPARQQGASSRGHSADHAIDRSAANQHAAPVVALSELRGRIDFVDGLLECVGRIMSASVSRKDRKDLTKRTDVLLEGLDMDDSPAWLVSAWTEDQVDVVVEASEALWAAEKTPDMSSSDVASIVSSVLSAL
eukprot:COSAG01_NODE_15023_length_1384_cov_2.540856_1_plen_335_part_10